MKCKKTAQSFGKSNIVSLNHGQIPSLIQLDNQKLSETLFQISRALQ